MGESARGGGGGGDSAGTRTRIPMQIEKSLISAPNRGLRALGPVKKSARMRGRLIKANARQNMKLIPNSHNTNGLNTPTQWPESQFQNGRLARESRQHQGDDECVVRLDLAPNGMR